MSVGICRIRSHAATACRGALCLLLILNVSHARAEGWLGSLRNAVRSSPPPSEPAPPDNAHRPVDDHDHHHDHYGSGGSSHDCDDDTTSLYELGGLFAAAAVTSPFWGPHKALGDDFEIDYLFPRFPYDHGPGYMTFDGWSPGGQEPGSPDLECGMPQERRWAARLSTEFADSFGDLDRIGGHLLLSTASRWGIDTEMHFLEETLAGGARDELWLGDCNLVYRFAQNEQMQWRTGIGFNWLDDPNETDFGFNFTYGLDWFPAKPWVISATLDWGNLGRAEQFRFRMTNGLILHGIETYIGYEYYDLDESQTNNFIAGVRIWF